jgi:hypothetical protein
MANNTSRGGKKQSIEKQKPGKKHQGVRAGSTATRKERHQTDKRKPVIGDNKSVRAKRSKSINATASDKQIARKGPAAKKVRDESPKKRSQIQAGTGKKNLYANMPKARKVR